MIDVAVIGLGKMGLSHLAIARAHPEVNLVGVCDSSGYVLDVLGKHTGVATFSDPESMLARTRLDAVIVATPSQLHAPMARAALDNGVNVFCEKPFTLDHTESTALASQAEGAGLVTQVGYHNRFVASFAEVKRLLDLDAIGEVTHVLAEAYGPVVLAPKGGTWRSRRASGGGCLYDYAAHPIDLVTWYLGAPTRVSGSILNSVFSAETDDEVFSTLHHASGQSAHISVSWSDESRRKMSTMVTIWGTRGRIFADRQEIQVYLRDGAAPPDGYRAGWNVRYTTDLTRPVWYYLRGEEYSAQIEDFVHRVGDHGRDGLNTFRSAAETDRVLGMIMADAQGVQSAAPDRADTLLGADLPSRNGAHRVSRLPRWAPFSRGGRR